MAKKRVQIKTGANNKAKRAKIDTKEHCIIHFNNISNGEFTRFSNINVAQQIKSMIKDSLNLLTQLNG